MRKADDVVADVRKATRELLNTDSAVVSASYPQFNKKGFWLAKYTYTVIVSIRAIRKHIKTIHGKALWDTFKVEKTRDDTHLGFVLAVGVKLDSGWNMIDGEMKWMG